ncbi:MAG: hypothetical protein ACK55Z_26025, partial [bacterium]
LLHRPYSYSVPSPHRLLKSHWPKLKSRCRKIKSRCGASDKICTSGHQRSRRCFVLLPLCTCDGN